MMLRPRAVVTSLIVALPAALLVTYGFDRVRANDMELALTRVVRVQVNDQVRERCESDPTWFLTGPLEGRPKGGIFIETSPDQLPPRPKSIAQPFELFAYDEQFLGSSSASARFPPDFRRVLRSSSDIVTAPYQTSAGTGVQVAVATGWIGSPCMYFLGRMEPMPNQRRQRMLTFAACFVLIFSMALLSSVPILTRVRRLARDAHQAVDAGYTAIGPDKLKDELSSLTFIYNDAATELQLRKTRIDDQDAALRRFVQSTDEEVARPLATLEAGLGALATRSGGAPTDEVRALLNDAHALSMQVENLAAAARLRMLGQTPAKAPVDLSALATEIVARHRPLADAAGVTLHLALPPTALVVSSDAQLLRRAIANIVDNAIRYNRRGGEVTVGLAPVSGESRFRLWVADNGRGVSEEDFRTLTAIRRFRGDEGRNRRPGTPGLGLAVARETADRFGLTLDLKRPGAGGFEAEFSGPLAG